MESDKTSYKIGMDILALVIIAYGIYSGSYAVFILAVLLMAVNTPTLTRFIEEKEKEKQKEKEKRIEEYSKRDFKISSSSIVDIEKFNQPYKPKKHVPVRGLYSLPNEEKKRIYVRGYWRRKSQYYK